MFVSQIHFSSFRSLNILTYALFKNLLFLRPEKQQLYLSFHEAEISRWLKLITPITGLKHEPKAGMLSRIVDLIHVSFDTPNPVHPIRLRVHRRRTPWHLMFLIRY
jgi:hypothetical protein